MSRLREIAAVVFRPLELEQPMRFSLVAGTAMSTPGLLAQGLLRFVTAWLVGHIAGVEVGVVASAIATATLLALLWPTTTGSAASKYLARARAPGRERAAGRSRTCPAGPSRPPDRAPGQSRSGCSSTTGPDRAQRASPCSRWPTRPTASPGASSSGRAGAARDVVGRAQRRGRPSLLVVLLWSASGAEPGAAPVLAYGIYTVAGWPHGAHGRPTRSTPRARRVRRARGRRVAGEHGFPPAVPDHRAKVTSGDADAGQYAAALNLATPASMLAASLSLVLFPSLAEAWGRGDHADFHAQTDRATRALAVVMVAIFGCLIIGSRLLVAGRLGRALRRGREGAPDPRAGRPRHQPRRGQRQRADHPVTTRHVGDHRCQSRRAGRRRRRLAPDTGSLGTTGVALGYLCGTLVIATVPVVITWRRGGHAWSGVFTRVAIGLAMVGLLVLLQHGANLSPWLDPALALRLPPGVGRAVSSRPAAAPVPAPVTPPMSRLLRSQPS